MFVSIVLIDILKTMQIKQRLFGKGDEPDQSRHISYQELYHEVCKLANAMEAKGIWQR